MSSFRCLRFGSKRSRLGCMSIGDCCLPSEHNLNSLTNVPQNSGPAIEMYVQYYVRQICNLLLWSRTSRVI